MAAPSGAGGRSRRQPNGGGESRGPCPFSWPSAELGDRATRDTALSAGRAATGTGEVAVNVAGMESSSGDKRVAADHVLAAASDLTRQSEQLLGVVERFLAMLKAA